MTGAVDKVLPPGKIAEELGRIALKGAVHLRAGESEGESFHKILEVLRARKKVDFSFYKTNTIHRRIERRMVLAKINKANRYVDFLKENPAELEALLQDLLINVTQFFRDPEVFEKLKAKILPRMIRGRSPDDPVRIWVAGCSTGQEAYSIAMAFLEFASASSIQVPLQIFATDLNETVFEKARVGRYTRSQVQDVSAARLKRFFIEEDGTFNVCKSIREMCVLAPAQCPCRPGLLAHGPDQLPQSPDLF